MGVLAGILLTVFLSPPSPEAVREAVRAMYKTERYQREIPAPRSATGTADDPEPTPERGEPSDSDPSRRPWRDSTRKPGDPPPPPREPPPEPERREPWNIPSWIGEALLWLVAIALGVVLLTALISRLRSRRRPVAAVGPRPSTPAQVVTFEVPLGEAEALAAQGRFGEAIHVLLLKTLALLGGAAGVPVPPALTSREILDRIPLDPPSRGALGALVDEVEISWFGGALPDADDWARCLEHFRRFAAVHGRAAA